MKFKLIDAQKARFPVSFMCRRGRKRKPTQDGRELRCYKRRWMVERFFAWLHLFRRLVTRYQRKAESFLGFLHIRCALILLRQF